MRLRYPLYSKILFWFFLNVALLGGAFYAFFAMQLRLRLDSLLSGRTGERVVAVTNVISRELRESPRESWNEILARFSDGYDVKFYVFRERGEQIGGPTMDFPAELNDVIKNKGNPPGIRPLGPLGRRRPAAVIQPVDASPKPPDPLFLIRTTKPVRYWTGVRAEVRSKDLRPPHTGIVVIMSESLTSGGLFLDLRPWILTGAGVIALCLLFWLPLVHGITRSIRQMTVATERIAEGQFASHVQAKRRDELGRLGRAINRMAARLEGFVTGQKRFLGDIAHELCSPIARIQMALGVLEQRLATGDTGSIEDLREEVEHMSEMVEELLLFSKASFQVSEVKLQRVQVSPLLDKVLARESSNDVTIKTDLEEGTAVLADEKLLSRSIANLVRNAVRYAGDSGPVTVSAKPNGTGVDVTVADSGPGVPEEGLQRIFDPFFRPESSRTRESGGAGLGLAIVKSCIEACNGSVTCKNREPSGFEVTLHLATAPAGT